jgi:hypothetical protein
MSNGLEAYDRERQVSIRLYSLFEFELFWTDTQPYKN